MLLSISTTQAPATDLGYLLHKNPARWQSFELSFGHAHVFYPQADDHVCTACLLLDVDPVGIVRGMRTAGGLLDQYVNDRPYVASSFLSVAISRVFGSALQGQSKERPELAATAIPLVAEIDVLPVRGGESLLREIFEPLGYGVTATRHPLDERFPQWGESPYYRVRLERTIRLAELLSHLYVLVPTFDAYKHYYIGRDELEKLLAKGAGWLAEHPQRDLIVRRYLKYRPSLARQALAQLVPEDEHELLEIDDQPPAPQTERELTLNQQRHAAVLNALVQSGARRVVDIGCGEGKLLRELLKQKQFDAILGVDVSIRALEAAQSRLKLDRLPASQAERIKLMHGSLMYRDRRLEGFDAAAVVEVIEHLDPPRLGAFERVLFEEARPGLVVLTTPNREYNVRWESLPAGAVRHADHRFEWSRHEFQAWAADVAGRFGYDVEFRPLGPDDELVGSPTQMGLFKRRGG